MLPLAIKVDDSTAKVHLTPCSHMIVTQPNLNIWRFKVTDKSSIPGGAVVVHAFIPPFEGRSP